MAPVPPAFAGETQGAGQWTGGGRVLVHLQRDLQQKPLAERCRDVLVSSRVTIYLASIWHLFGALSK
jgi:hypothetical protein